jgi:DNA repair exonuclease SbcCD ATPase subunit
MACKFIRKSVMGAALGAGALALLFGTAAPSYVKTAFHRVRHNAKEAVPIQFQIDMARQQVADLDPALREQIETLARAEEDVKELNAELVAIKENNTKEKKTITALRKNLDGGDFRLADSSVSYTAEELKTDLRRRFDHYRQVQKIVTEKERTLKAKERAVASAREMLANIRSQRRELMTKIEEIEARHKAIEATRSTNEFNFDDSALAGVKRTVADLERRLNVEARTAELEGKFADPAVPVVVEPSGDVVKEIDAAFGDTKTDSDSRSAEKSL